jgi:hypothetical protein
MPTTRSTKTNGGLPSGHTTAKNTEPIQTHQQKIQQDDNDSAIPNHAMGATAPKTKQKRGRPRAAIEPTSNSENNSADKHNEDPGEATRDGKDGPPAKRTKVSSSKPTETPIKATHMKANKGRTRKQPREHVARDPLPDRRGRNIHPAAGQLTTRRTSQEVTADRESQRRALEEKIRQGEKAKELFALMSIAEEQFDEEMLTRNPQRLSAAILKHGRDCLEEDSEVGEVFNFEEVDNGTTSESDDSVVQPQAKAAELKSKVSTQQYVWMYFIK